VSRYCYEPSRVNDYYRAILSMCDLGWFGGIRWLFGEDSAGSVPSVPPA
jgi:hypothetical protein